MNIFLSSIFVITDIWQNFSPDLSSSISFIWMCCNKWCLFKFYSTIHLELTDILLKMNNFFKFLIRNRYNFHFPRFIDSIAYLFHFGFEFSSLQVCGQVANNVPNETISFLKQKKKPSHRMYGHIATIFKNCEKRFVFFMIDFQFWVVWK